MDASRVPFVECYGQHCRGVSQEAIPKRVCEQIGRCGRRMRGHAYLIICIDCRLPAAAGLGWQFLFASPAAAEKDPRGVPRRGSFPKRKPRAA